MSGIYNGIQALLDSFLAPLKFIASIIAWTNRMLQMLADTITEIISLLNGIPEWLVAYMSLAIVIIVLYQIIGRGTGK